MEEGRRKKSKKLGVFFGISIVLLLFFGFTFGREALKNYEISQEIKNLERQAEDLEVKNAELADLSKKLNTLEYLESEARTKFGLKKEGEQAAIIVPENGVSIIKNTIRAGEQKNNNSNSSKWWNYFFGEKSKTQ